MKVCLHVKKVDPYSITSVGDGAHPHFQGRETAGGVDPLWLRHAASASSALRLPAQYSTVVTQLLLILPTSKGWMPESSFAGSRNKLSEIERLDPGLNRGPIALESGTIPTELKPAEIRI